VTDIAPNGEPYESVWDYPRPPRLEVVPWRIRVVHAGTVVVDAPDAIRVLETSQPPAYYVHPDHVRVDLLAPSTTTTFCEWKGRAGYVDLAVDGIRVPDAAWFYASPTAGFAAIAGRFAFYAQKVDECRVDDEPVDANEGRFYGGWITQNVTGPFKGAPGTAHW
jgi:uncharacterized protein (DUF427 family)